MALALLRLGYVQWQIVHSVYQGDFTAYYVAGQALVHGADPYRYQPPAVRGTPFYYTGFLYPPLVAEFFRPLAHLDFYHAKLVWSALQLACLTAALALTACLVWPRAAALGTAVLFAAAAVFPPTLLEFERGQIDCLTLLLIVGGVWAWTVRQNSGLAAVLLVAAGVFKLPALLLLVVPLALGDIKFIKAAAASLLVVAVLSLSLNGAGLTQRYWFHYLPAIAGLTHAAVNPGNPPPAPPTLPGALPASQGGPVQWPHVVWEGHSYDEKSTFPTRGSFVSSYMNPLPEKARKLGSGLGYLLGLAVIVLAARAPRRALSAAEQARLEQSLLAVAMIVILVCNTLTWLMNYVWLLYAIPILLVAAWDWRVPRLILVGLAAGGLLNFTWFVPHVTGILYKALDQRFCIGALVLYAAALLLLIQYKQGTEGLNGRS